MGGVLRRLSDQPGERNERRRRDDEERHIVDVESVERDHDRRKDERDPEEASEHRG
jgi:hypothetical protein